ncbi:hypothetical protein [Paracoccus laeviglucosivorans]|uniref:VPS28 protein n=1 Tax=Paracoccus laeviglucosivorans TaxID=1197861 RepID=A0A521E420_9RHOB|nr:hypothetical protein [Paracoccus laeviglucosivorans]SMO78704.1 VPS28 protein [Paracoccus laeviglucosivorans]
MAEEPDLIISAGFSDAQLVAEQNKVVAAFRKRGEEAQKAFQDAQGKVSNTAAARAHARDLDRLARAYDPAYRAAKIYEDQVKRLDRAMDVGAISQKQYTAEVVRAAQQMKGAGESVEQTGRKIGSTGNLMQQFGYQAGDFAVQVQAGTSAAQAFAQQAPQFLGAMGAWGAMAGLGVAVAVPVGAALLRMAKDTETLEDKLKSLEETTTAYLDAVEAQTTPIDQLRMQYGDLADEIQRVNDVTANFTGAMAVRDLLGTAAKMSSGFGDLRSSMTPQFVADLEAMDIGQGNIGFRGFDPYTIQNMEKRLKITREEAIRLAQALEAVGRAKGPAELAPAMETYLGLLQSVTADQKNLSDETKTMIETAIAVFKAAADQASAVERARQQAQQELLDAYDSNTQKLKKLANDRQTAEEMLAQAVKTGDKDRIASSNEVIKQIDREAEKVRQLARESDASYRSMARAYKEYADSRMAGNEWANSAAGFEAEYVARRASGAGSADEELVRAVVALSEQMGIAAKDLLAVMSFETGGRLRPDVMGPTTSQGQHFGLIQFGDKGSGPRYGVTPDSSITEQVIATGRYLQDAGVKAGDSIANIYAAVLAGDARKVNASDLAAGGVVGNVTAATSGDQFAVHLARAEGMLAANGSAEDAARKAHAETTQKLKEEVRERERIAKQVKDYGLQLSKNLLSEQKQAELAAEQAEKIAAIKASGMDETAQARAIADVTAEVEKQRVVFTLLEEAKRRQVDLDAMMADGSMTYRQAIAALGEAKRDEIIATNERAIAEGKAAEAQQLMADAQEMTKNGLLDSIVAGESFADVLKNLAQMFARAALQAALFNEGALASGSGRGLLGGLVSGIFGGGGQRVVGNDAMANSLRGINGFRASGGGVKAGLAYQVNEHTPRSEIFVPSHSGAILNVAQAQAALASRPGGNTLRATFAPSISIAPGVTQAELAMTMQAAREEYERNFVNMLQNNMPSYQERYS